MKSYYKLGIVIPTRNRAEFLIETIDNIFHNLLCEIEVIIVDGSTSNDTEIILKSYIQSNKVIYFKQISNNGFDYDLNFGIIRSNAEFVWMFSDDDLISGNDINKVYNDINNNDYDFYIINSIIYDKDFLNVLQNKFVLLDDMSGDDLNILFKYFIDYFSFFGGCILKKNLWLESNPVNYFGSLFVHIGVIFGPGKSLKWKFLSNPIIKIRYGNASWTNNYMKIWLLQWPNLLKSFKKIDNNLINIKTKFTFTQIIKKLIFIKALGLYNPKILLDIQVGISKNNLKIVKIVLFFLPKFLCKKTSIIYSKIHNKNIMLYDLYN
jgi:glycosyltransferase involved in cell wall biosynthesis